MDLKGRKYESNEYYDSIDVKKDCSLRLKISYKWCK